MVKVTNAESQVNKTPSTTGWLWVKCTLGVVADVSGVHRLLVALTFYQEADIFIIFMDVSRTRGMNYGKNCTGGRIQTDRPVSTHFLFL